MPGVNWVKLATFEKPGVNAPNDVGPSVAVPLQLPSKYDEDLRIGMHCPLGPSQYSFSVQVRAAAHSASVPLLVSTKTPHLAWHNNC